MIPGSESRRYLGAVLLSNFFASIAFSILSPAMVANLVQVRTSALLIAVATSIWALPSAVGGPFYTRFIARYSARRWLVIGVFVYALVLLSFPFIRGIWAWIALQLVSGIALGHFFIVCGAWVNHFSPETARGRVTAIYGILPAVGYAIGSGIYALVGFEGFAPFVVAGPRRAPAFRQSLAGWTWLAVMAAPLVAPCAHSQVAQDNAVLAASDAFGTQIDQQSIGLYSQTAARGFSPQQAGNLRIEGLYFDQETLITNPCLVHETDMRVGIAAQSFSFPSPTGIADLKLRHPGDAQEFSALLTRGPFESETATLEAQLPAPALNFGVDLCAAYYYNFDLDAARRSHGAIYSATASWHPGGTFEILPFAGLIVGSERDQLPVVYTDGTYPLQAFVERDLLTQKGLGYGWHQLTAGTIVRAQLTEEWRLLAGAFFSQERDPINVNPYFVVQSGGMADYALDVVPPASQQSESGELQLARQFAHTTHEELIEFTARGRNVDRQFGGDQITDFGTINLLAQSNFMELPPQFSSINHDLVRQVDVGVLFEERWHDIGSIALGVLGDHYHRRLTLDGEAASENQLLKSVRFTLQGGPSLLAYGSYVQGVEDSPLAPTNAANRGELPSSSLTWQVDAGIRWSPISAVQLIVGGFEIHKPYLALDNLDVYRPIGRLTHQGIETSLSVSAEGLTLLAGGVYLRPRAEIAGPPAETQVPLGPVPVTLTGNIDYAPISWRGWGSSLQINWLSSRTATLDETSYLPPLTTVGAGMRYEGKWRDHHWSIRLDGFNLTDAHGLHISNIGLVLPEERRRVMLTLAADS